MEFWTQLNILIIFIQRILKQSINLSKELIFMDILVQEQPIYQEKGIVCIF